MNSVIKFKNYTDSAISVLDLVSTPEKAERNKAHLYNVAVDAHNLLTRFVSWHPSSDIEGDMLENKMSKKTIMRALTQKRRYGAGDYLTPIDYNLFVKEQNTALYQAFCAILDADEYNSIKQHRSHIEADTLMMRLGYLANMVNKKISEVSELLGKADYTHMESFSQKITFDLSKWYDVLRNEGVIIGIDEALFCDCISHAHMNELFKNGKTAKLKCAIHHIKNGYEPRWFDVVCINLGVSKQEMGKFNLGKKRKEFEKKLPF